MCTLVLRKYFLCLFNSLCSISKDFLRYEIGENSLNLDNLLLISFIASIFLKDSRFLEGQDLIHYRAQIRQ